MRSPWLLVLLLGACSATDLPSHPGPDSGPPATDAGPRLPPDSGSPIHPDAGPPDAGPPRPDAGAPDAGPSHPDAGPPHVDAGPTDAGPARCDLVDGACVHSGDTSTFCAPQYATFIDAQRACYVPGNLYACAVTAGFGCGLVASDHAVCDADGGLSEIIEYDECNLVPPVARYCAPPVPLDPIFEALATPGDHQCAPDGVEQGHCELVGNTCVHTGDPDTYCLPQHGTVVDPDRMCVVPDRDTYACVLRRGPFGTCQGNYTCYVLGDGDGGIADYVFADNSCLQVPPSPTYCDYSTVRPVIETLNAGGSLPTCAP